eukprot:516767-Hanusia_phi.AAC.1
MSSGLDELSRSVESTSSALSQIQNLLVKSIQDGADSNSAMRGMQDKEEQISNLMEKLKLMIRPEDHEQVKQKLGKLEADLQAALNLVQEKENELKD